MLRGTEKAAAVLSLLGDELAHRILSNLPEDVAVSIMNASEHLRTPTREELIDAVSDFNQSMSVPMPPEAAEQAQAPSEEAPLPENMAPLDRISAAKPEAVAAVLKPERPEIAAYVLSHLPIEKIYEVLTMLGDRREAVESRLISIKDVPIAKDLEEKILKNISERLV